MQWLLTKHYRKISGYQIYAKEISKTENLDERNFTFGETTPLTVKLLLQEISPQKGSIVYDLGCGRGIFLFSAYFIFALRGVGIELFDTYVRKSREIAKKLKTAGLIFKQGNITEADLADADIVYFAATSFQADVVEKVTQNLNGTKPGTIIITVHKPLEGENFVLFNEGSFPFSWGTDYVYFYKRKNSLI